MPRLFVGTLAGLAAGLILTLVPWGAAAMTPDVFQIIPKPKEFTVHEGDGLAPGALRGLALADGQRPVMPPLLDGLPLTGQSGAGTLTLRLANAAELPDSTEGYRLTIRDGAVEIASRGQAGLFYGCQTLQQLLEDAHDADMALPPLTIRDWPTLSYRAVHIDTKHHLDTVKYYYDLIDRLAAVKLNGIIWEFEDKLGYRLRPVVAAPQHITLEEMEAITRYARERHIDLSPLIQGLGHATFILKHDEYAHLREKPDDRWAFCPSLDETYDVQFDLYRDAIQATPGGRYLHVGGDEVSVGTCPRCKPVAEREGKLALNLLWLNKVCEFARRNGRIPIFWDDMIFNHAGVYGTMHRDRPHEEVVAAWEKGLPVMEKLLPRFPKDCVYMRWNYGLAREEGNQRALDWYQQHGLSAMIATAAQCTMPLFPDASRLPAIESFTGLAAERGISGMLCTAWDDCSPHMETYWRGLCAAAEYGWAPKGRTLAEYEGAYLQRSFGPDARDATALYAGLIDSIGFWNRALVQGGDRERYRELIDLPDRAHPGAWSEKHKDRLALARAETQKAQLRGVEILGLSGQARRNRYQLQILAVINRLQVTPSRLLVALEAADATDGTQGAGAVRAALNEYAEAWKHFKAVCGETRLLEYPGYVPDHYFHFASRVHGIEFMTMVEDNLHPQVEQWLQAQR